MHPDSQFSIPLSNVIFDMDGVLLDTEPLWGISMTRVAESFGIQILPFQFKYTTGLKINEVTSFWKKNLFPHLEFDSEKLAEDIVDDIIALSKQNASVLPGIISHLEFLKKNNIRLAVATSSPQRMMDELLNFFQIKSYFDYCQSAENCQYGKPHPEVYLKALERINGQAAESCAVEDSVNGMIAAKAAKMRVVIIPESHLFHDQKFGLADRKYSSMDSMPTNEWHKICQ